MSNERFVTDYLIVITHRAALHLAATHTFDNACMVATLSGSALFSAKLDAMTDADIIALSIKAGNDCLYYYQALAFLKACEVNDAPQS